MSALPSRSANRSQRRVPRRYPPRQTASSCAPGSLAASSVRRRRCRGRRGRHAAPASVPPSASACSGWLRQFALARDARMGLVEPGPHSANNGALCARRTARRASAGWPRTVARWHTVRRCVAGPQRQRRLGGRVHVEELAPRMRPARGSHAAIYSPAYPAYPSACRMPRNRARCVLGCSPFDRDCSNTVPPAAPSRRTADHRAHSTTAARSWSCRGRGPHRHRGVVGVHPFRRHHVRTDRLDQRTHQRRGLSHPTSQCRPVQIEAVAGIDLGLAIQRQVVAVFRHQHMRQQTRPGQAALDRQAWGRRLGDRSRSSGTTASAAHAA